MAFADNAFTVTLLDETLTQIFKLDKKKAQFARMGETSQWFHPAGEILRGKRYNFWVYTTPSTGTRRSDFSTAESAAFPAASQPSYTKLSYDMVDVTIFQCSLKFNELAQLQSEDLKSSVWEVANKLVMEAVLDFKSQHNVALHQSTACLMGTANAVYDEDGTTYTSGQTDAFVQILDKPVSQFLPGQLLKASSRTLAELTLVVKDVIVGTSGPWSGATRVADVGPGITVERSSGTDANLDSFVATNTLSLSGEGAGDNYNGFPSWFSGITNVYNDEDGAAIDRDAIGNAWQIPEIFDYESAGDAVNFDLELHFREVAETLPFRVNAGRLNRAGLGPIQSANVGVNLPSVLVGVTTPGIANEAIATAADTQRFTMETASSMDAAKRRALFGDVGFEGVVWHSPTLPPIAIQADKASQPERMRILDPQSWFTLKLRGDAMQWLDNGPSRWVRVTSSGDDDRLTYYKQAACWSSGLLGCDQPGANAEIMGIKSSTVSAI